MPSEAKDIKEEQVGGQFIHDLKRRTETPAVSEKIWIRILAVILFSLLVYLMFNVNVRADTNIEYISGAFGTLGFIYLMSKLLLSFFYKPVREEPNKDYKVSVIVPSFNEGVESVKKTIDCLLKQDYPLYEIIFIDDGSEDITGYKEVQKIAATINHGANSQSMPFIITHRFKKNKGKKEAQAWGFKKSKGDILMLADSDGYIFPDAVREMLKPFNDEKVTAVVGHINARNLKDNFMTRLQDILYHNSFRIGRASQSVTNCVIVCSGALSMHRRKMVIENLDEFLEPKVAGIKLSNGDDRCLTNISLKYGGKTKYQSTAVCITDVPTTISKFFKQQVRWARSYFLFTIETMKHAWKRPLVAYWILGEGLLWIVFGSSKILSFINWSGEFYWLFFIYTVAYFITASFISGLYYVFKNPFLFIAAPIFTVVQTLLTIPIRFYSLITINKDGWNTR